MGAKPHAVIGEERSVLEGVGPQHAEDEGLKLHGIGFLRKDRMRMNRLNINFTIISKRISDY